MACLNCSRCVATLPSIHPPLRQWPRSPPFVPLSLWTVRILSSCSTPQAPLASPRASCTPRQATCSTPRSPRRWVWPSCVLAAITGVGGASISHCSSPSAHSMCLTTVLEISMHAWLTLAGSLVTPMWSMVLSPMVPPVYCLRVPPSILTLVCFTCTCTVHVYIYIYIHVCTSACPLVRDVLISLYKPV